MDKQPFFSIIVPVYNTEAYLHDCVDSMLAQDFTDYEVILVDDESPDSSPAICDAYAEQYQNIRVIHKKNGGVSAARNTGIKAAKGEYILFSDSDDFFVGHNAFRILAQELKNLSPDMLLFLPAEYDAAGTKRIKTYSDGEWEQHKLLQADDIVNSIYLATGIWVTQVMSKIIKRSFCLDHRLLFAKGVYHEDDEWVARAYLCHPAISFLYLPLYGRRIRENSITTSVDKRVRQKNIYDNITVTAMMLSNPGGKPHKHYMRYCVDYFSNTILRAADMKGEQRSAFLQFVSSHKKCLKRAVYTRSLKHILKALIILVFGAEKFVAGYERKRNA